jgi:hypothetical protein
LTQEKWIPAFAGLRRQDAEANIRVANGPKGELRTQRVMTADIFAVSALIDRP